MDTDYHTPMEALKLDCHPVPCIPSIVSSLVTHVLQSPGSTQWPGSSIKVKYYILGLTLNGQIGCLFYLDARQNFLAQMKYIMSPGQETPSRPLSTLANGSSLRIPDTPLTCDLCSS